MSRTLLSKAKGIQFVRRNTRHDATHASINSISKRAFDVACALGALLFLSPLLLAIAVLIKLDDGGPVLFRQRRIGRDGRHFPFLKFRSMSVNAEAALAELIQRDAEAAKEWNKYKKLKKDPRITKIGHFIRRSSIDELPQLINILTGDMSVIGPRPIMSDQIDDYGSNFDHYCAVRPGLSGLWQVSGRNEKTFQERASLDAEYVKSWTFFGDVKLVAQTVPVVLLSKGSF
ncbi:MAG: UDP-phosphate galactose phosphotransferase [Ponticaulis sp.]|nr:UDP-phosphate galactose phosphotransferase [Ponticaulis sp.]